MGPRMREDTERGGMMATRFHEELGMTCGWGRGIGFRMCEDMTGRACGWGRAVREPPLRGEEVRRREGNKIP